MGHVTATSDTQNKEDGEGEMCVDNVDYREEGAGLA